MEQNFEMQSIRLKNETAKLKLEHTEAQEMARTQGQKDMQEVRDTLAERKATRGKFLHDFEQGTVTAVDKIKAEAREVTTKLNFEYHQVLQTLKLEADEKAAAIEADTAAKVEKLQAETKRDTAQNEGEATKAIAAAEANSNSYLLNARQFELVDRCVHFLRPVILGSEEFLFHADRLSDQLHQISTLFFFGLLIIKFQLTI